MDTCDVLIVGGGPAGSSCAWKLRGSGLNVAILDKQVFPRDKICGGWITPAVLQALEIDPEEYAQANVLQPITGFRTGRIRGRSIETDYGAVVSYGIRRREFDHYLLLRCPARLLQNTAVRSLERAGGYWIINGQIRSRMLVGAGGHFCPVARMTASKPGPESVVVAQEAEFEMDARQMNACRVEAVEPELYFCPDIRGYGWCFRKGNFLNVGLGRMDPHRLSEHVAGFLRFLRSEGRIGFDLPMAPCGHAYLLYGRSPRGLLHDGLLLIGDAAGLAFPQSGEGILPAVESGLFGATAILDADGDYRRERLESYPEALTRRFGSSEEHWTTRISARVPSVAIRSISGPLLSSRWFAREVLLNRWFLHAS
ncbi:MAG TPA: NAD(P)/FAD-dependent oxidoreductase [Bryobacteraceae bacterium]|nr:NAD(P)/FAD-dependent oxidoreductase [Bryobacteraceae bacterium]